MAVVIGDGVFLGSPMNFYIPMYIVFDPHEPMSIDAYTAPHTDTGGVIDLDVKSGAASITGIDVLHDHNGYGSGYAINVESQTGTQAAAKTTGAHMITLTTTGAHADSTTYGINIDANAKATDVVAINVDADVATALGAGKVVSGAVIDILGHASDNDTSELHGLTIVVAGQADAQPIYGASIEVKQAGFGGVTVYGFKVLADNDFSPSETDATLISFYADIQPDSFGTAAGKGVYGVGIVLSTANLSAASGSAYGYHFSVAHDLATSIDNIYGLYSTATIGVAASSTVDNDVVAHHFDITLGQTGAITAMIVGDLKGNEFTFTLGDVAATGTVAGNVYGSDIAITLGALGNITSNALISYGTLSNPAGAAIAGDYIGGSYHVISGGGQWGSAGTDRLFAYGAVLNPTGTVAAATYAFFAALGAVVPTGLRLVQDASADTLSSDRTVAGSLIDIDIDANVAGNVVIFDTVATKKTTGMGAGNYLYGLSFNLDGIAGDNAASFVRGLYFTSANTTGGVSTAIYVDSHWDVGFRGTSTTAQTGGWFDIDLTTSTNGGISLFNYKFTTHNLANAEWAYGLYGTFNSSAAATATSNAAAIYLAAPTPSATCNDYGIYIEAGYDWAIAAAGPVVFAALTLAPSSDPIVGSSYPLDFQLEGWGTAGTGTAGVYTQGRIINGEYGAARTLDGSLHWMYSDLATNVTHGAQQMTGWYLSLPATTYDYDAGSHASVIEVSSLQTIGPHARFSVRHTQDSSFDILMGAATAIAAGQTWRGIRVTDAGNALTVAAGTTAVGMEVNLATAAVANDATADLYGFSVILPAGAGSSSDIRGFTVSMQNNSVGLDIQVNAAGTTASPINIDLTQFQGGGVIDTRFVAAETLTGQTTWAYVDFTTNVTSADQNIYGVNVLLPADVGASTAGFALTSNMDRGYGVYLDFGGTGVAGQTVRGFYVNADDMNMTVGNFYGLEVDASSMTVGGNIYGVFVVFPSTFGAGTEYMAYFQGSQNTVYIIDGATCVSVTADRSNADNSQRPFFISKDLTLSAAAAANYDISNGAILVTEALANTNDDVGGFRITAADDVLGVTITHTMNTTAAATDAISLTLLDLTFSSTTAAATDTANITTRAADITYTLTETAGTINLNATDIFRINVDVGAGVGICNAGAGNLNFLLVDGDGFVPGATFLNTTVVSGFYIDLGSANLAADADATLYGLRIDLPASYAANGGAANSAVHATGNGNTFDALMGDGLRITMGEAGSTAVNLFSDTTDADNAKIGVVISKDMTATGAARAMTASFIDLTSAIVSNGGNASWNDGFIDVDLTLTETINVLTYSGTLASFAVACGVTSPLVSGGGVAVSYAGSGVISDTFTGYGLTMNLNHDDAAGDTMRGFYATWTGTLPGTNAGTNLKLFDAAYSGTMGAAGANASVYGFYNDMSGATVTAGTLVSYYGRLPAAGKFMVLDASTTQYTANLTAGLIDIDVNVDTATAGTNFTVADMVILRAAADTGATYAWSVELQVSGVGASTMAGYRVVMGNDYSPSGASYGYGLYIDADPDEVGLELAGVRMEYTAANADSGIYDVFGFHLTGTHNSLQTLTDWYPFYSAMTLGGAGGALVGMLSSNAELVHNEFKMDQGGGATVAISGYVYGTYNYIYTAAGVGAADVMGAIYGTYNRLVGVANCTYDADVCGTVNSLTGAGTWGNAVGDKISSIYNTVNLSGTTTGTVTNILDIATLGVDYDHYIALGAAVPTAIRIVQDTATTDLYGTALSATRTADGSLIDIDVQAANITYTVIDIGMTGTVAAADTQKAIYINLDQTLFHASSALYGAEVNLDSVTVTTSAAVYGILIDADGITTPGNATLFGGLAIGVPTGTNAILLLGSTGVSKIATAPVAGVTRQIQFDIPVAAGGAGGAALDHQFLIDGTMEAGLLAETDGAGGYTHTATDGPVWLIPYFSGDYKAVGDWDTPPAPAPTSLANGSMFVAHCTGGSVGPDRLYVYSNGAWHYVTLT